MGDRDIVGVQIGRPSRAPVDVVGRCHLDLPVVVRMPPVLDDGTPFPTRFWLTCPLAVRRISRLEAVGAVESLTAEVAADPGLADEMAAAHLRYAAERDAAGTAGGAHGPRGGVAGITGTGLKCLHAHYADHAAGNDNPVGLLTGNWVEPLDCPVPCVVDIDGGAAPNPEWREPA